VIGGEVGLDALVGEHKIATGFRRVENQAIEPRRAVDDLVGEGSDIPHQRKIASHHLEIGIRNAAPNMVDGCLASLWRTRSNQHPCTPFAELTRDRFADASRCTGHKNGGLLPTARRLLSHRKARHSPKGPTEGWVK